ncbi:MAG TPA: non-ribosomal peptide synthetase, partial [Gammaproteobacteria bacterium]|nr:non-ribosomal peptide synthetase [Gammaproteobacteria bacterium]
EARLAAIWTEVLGLERVGVEDNFFELGGDSILSIQIIARARQAGLDLKPRQLFEHQTIAGLAAAAGNLAATGVEQGPFQGEAPMTPIQCWFFEHAFSNPHHWNQPALLELHCDIDDATLAHAFERLARHHDMLRARFLPGPEGWRCIVGGQADRIDLETVDLSALSPARRQAAFDELARRLQTALDITDGPLLRAARVHGGPGTADLLLVVVHHLVMDAVSWRILLEDLERLCHDGEAALPPRSTPYARWAEALCKAAESAPLLAELPFWRDQGDAPALPVDATEHGPNDEASAALVRRELDADTTRRLLSDCHGAYRTRINDLLITALLRTLGDWSGQRQQVLTLEAHGREEIQDDIDHSRTVGWFTTLYPLRFELPAGDDPGLHIKATKERLRAVPRNGIGYGILRYLGPEPVRRELAAAPRPRVLFNYLGQLDADRAGDHALRWIQQDLGADHDPACPRDHWLDFNAHVSDGRLCLELTFSRHRHSAATASRLADAYLDNLRSLVAHCTDEAHFGYTPSDFPLARLDQATLDSHPDLKDRRLQDVYPLSPLQSGMLFHSLHHPGSGEYLEQYLCTLEGELDVEAFTRAWQRLIDRHGILRTRFLWDGLDEPLQAVMTDATLPWRIEDWRDSDAAGRRARLDDYLAHDRRSGLLLSQAPLMRMLLARLENDRYQLVWSFHHLLMDGWCLHLVLDEVFAHYRALRSGQQATLPQPRPYRDFIAWQRGQDQDAAQQYWTTLLAGFDSPNRIRLGPVAATDATTANLRRALPAALGQRLQALAREHHLTLNTLVQGAWSLLLNRYSGQRDVVFGVTVSGRTPEIEGAEHMIGLFIN